jgi:prolipoprotein diacylglyceryl transferase
LNWNVDPVLFSLGPITIKWYGLLFASAFLVGTSIMTRVYRRELKPEEDIGTLLAYMMLATVVGARLGHCLFYDPEFYFSHPLEILKVWKGGLASHGGAIGITIGLWLYSRKRQSQPFLWLLDRITIPAALGGSLIRIGNLFNSEIVGDPTSVPWAITFQRLDSIPRHPAQLYEALAYIAIFAWLSVIYRRSGASLKNGRLIGLFLISVFSARFVLEFVKTQQAAYTISLGLSVGQLLSIPAIGLGLWLWLHSKRQGLSG